MSLYVILLTLHNLNRWLVLLSGIWALLRVSGNPANALALRSDCR